MKTVDDIQLYDDKAKTILATFNMIFWPVLFTFLITAILGIMDTVMISRYDTDAVLGVKSILTFSQTISPMFWAVITGIGIYSVNYIGTKDLPMLRKTFALQIMVAVAYGIIGFTIETVFSSQIIGVFVDKSVDPEAYYHAKDFAQFYRFNFLVYPINLIFTFQYKHENKTRLAFLTSTALIITNLFLNWLFIFQLEIGVGGASLATLLSNIIFIFVNIAIANINHMYFVEDFTESIKIPFDLLRKIFRFTLPIIVSESLFSIGRYVYSYGFSIVSTQSFITDRVAFQMMAIPDAFIMAGATAVSIVIGYELKHKKPRGEVIKVAKVLVRVMSLISFAALLVSFVVLPRITNIYGIPSPTYHSKLVFYIQINGVYLLFKGFAYTSLFIIRTGGDRRYGVYVDAITTWFVGIPLIFMGEIVFGLSGQEVKVLQLLDILVHSFFLVRRYKKGVWLEGTT